MATVVIFGREPGLGAIWASLLCVRRAYRDVQGGVRVAEGGSEDVGGPEVRGGNEARNLGLSDVITGLSSSVDEGGDRVVATSSLVQGAAGGVGGAGIKGADMAGGAGYGFAGRTQAQADRVDVLLGLHRSVVEVDPP